MENGERMSLEALGKVLDMIGDFSKGTFTISAKGIAVLIKNKSCIKAGINNINKLKNSGEPLNVVKIQEKDYTEIFKACEEVGVPISISRIKDDNILFFRQSDSKLVEMVMQKILETQLDLKSEVLKYNEKNLEIPSELDSKLDVTVADFEDVREQLKFIQNENVARIKGKDIPIFIDSQENIIAGNDKFIKFSKSKEMLNMIKLNNKYTDKFKKISEDFIIPMIIIQNNDNKFAFVNEQDLNRLQLVLQNELKIEFLPEDKVKIQELTLKIAEQEHHNKEYSLDIAYSEDTKMKDIMNKELDKNINKVELMKVELEQLIIQSEKNVLEKPKNVNIDNLEVSHDKYNNYNVALEQESNNDKITKLNPDNNIRTKVDKAEQRLNTPSMDRTIDVVKETTMPKVMDR